MLRKLMPLLLLLGCSAAPPPSDADVERNFAAHRQNFEALAVAVYEAPEITRIDLRNDPVEVVPAAIPEARLGPIVQKMKAAGISQIGAEPSAGGKHIGFLIYASGLGVSGRLKEVVYGPGQPGCFAVADTDEALEANMDRSVCVTKKLDDNWYIRASN